MGPPPVPRARQRELPAPAPLAWPATTAGLARHLEGAVCREGGPGRPARPSPTRAATAPPRAPQGDPPLAQRAPRSRPGRVSSVPRASSCSPAGADGQRRTHRSGPHPGRDWRLAPWGVAAVSRRRRKGLTPDTPGTAYLPPFWYHGRCTRTARRSPRPSCGRRGEPPSWENHPNRDPVGGLVDRRPCPDALAATVAARLGAGRPPGARPVGLRARSGGSCADRP